MSKYDIGVGEAFPLDESQPQDDCSGHRGRHHHHHHRGHHDYDHDDHHHGRHARGHHHMHMAALAMLFALKAYRHRSRPAAEQE